MTKRRIFTNAIFQSSLAIATLILTLTISGGGHAAAQSEAPSAKSPGLDRSQVCFVNDTYLGRPQIPVTVEGKIYYGCCAGCAKRLKTDRSVRFAIDPHTGNEVDKATAFVTLDARGASKVLYFASPETYEAYRRAQK